MLDMESNGATAEEMITTPYRIAGDQKITMK